MHAPPTRETCFFQLHGAATRYNILLILIVYQYRACSGGKRKVARATSISLACSRYFILRVVLIVESAHALVGVGAVETGVGVEFARRSAQEETEKDFGVSCLPAASPAYILHMGNLRPRGLRCGSLICFVFADKTGRPKTGDAVFGREIDRIDGYQHSLEDPPAPL